MVVEFAKEGEEIFRQIMNSATGGCIALIVFGMAVIMIVRANKSLSKLYIDKSGK